MCHQHTQQQKIILSLSLSLSSLTTNPKHTASGIGRYHILSALLEYTNVNREQVESRVSIQVENKTEHVETTALVVACANGHETCVKCLLDYSVDPDITTSNGTSPVLALSVCCDSQKSKIHILRRLIRANADLNQGNDRGMTPLQVLESRKEMSALKVLVSAGANDHPTTESWDSTCRYVCRQIQRGKGVSVCRDRIMSNKLLPRSSEKDHLWVLMQEDLSTSSSASEKKSQCSLVPSPTRRSSRDSETSLPVRVAHRRCYFCRTGTSVGFEEEHIALQTKEASANVRLCVRRTRKIRKILTTAGK